MDTKIIEYYLYDRSVKDTIAFLSSCSESAYLHIYAYNYNWNNGFEVPKVIIENPVCTLSTALMVFYLADGYRYLLEKPEISDIPDWLSFLSNLYTRIVSNSYTDKSIAFNVPLSKVQIFKLKKQLAEYEQLFITPIDGTNLNVTL